MNRPPPPELLEEMKRRQRRQRWSAFLTPLITLGSVVGSIGLLMFFLRTCGAPLPHNAPLTQGGTLPPAAFPARAQS
jgi:hypothetical protein